MLLHQLGRDVRDGLRQVRRNPAFSAVAVATLALGIGANTGMFSAVDAVLIRPLPYADAGRLVMVWDDVRRTDSTHFFTTPAEWSEWRRQNTVFTDIAASQTRRRRALGRRRARRSPARKVTANFWSVLDVKPLARPRLHRKRRRHGRAGRRHQLRTVAAALRRVAGCRRPHDHAERHGVRSHRRDATSENTQG